MSGCLPPVTGVSVVHVLDVTEELLIQKIPQRIKQNPKMTRKSLGIESFQRLSTVLLIWNTELNSWFVIFDIISTFVSENGRGDDDDFQNDVERVISASASSSSSNISYKSCYQSASEYETDVEAKEYETDDETKERPSTKGATGESLRKFLI